MELKAIAERYNFSLRELEDCLLYVKTNERVQQCCIIANSYGISLWDAANGAYDTIELTGVELTDPYQNFADAWHRFWFSVYDALKIPQIVDWINSKINK
jgi:hypothetical protein